MSAYREEHVDHDGQGGDLNSGVVNVVFVDGRVDSALVKDSYEIASPK